MIHYGVPVEPVRWLFITAGLLYIVVLLIPLTRLPRKNVTAEKHRCRWPTGCESPRGTATGQFCRQHFDQATNLNPPEFR